MITSLPISAAVPITQWQRAQAGWREKCICNHHRKWKWKWKWKQWKRAMFQATITNHNHHHHHHRRRHHHCRHTANERHTDRAKKSIIFCLLRAFVVMCSQTIVYNSHYSCFGGRVLPFVFLCSLLISLGSFVQNHFIVCNFCIGKLNTHTPTNYQHATNANYRTRYANKHTKFHSIMCWRWSWLPTLNSVCLFFSRCVLLWAEKYMYENYSLYHRRCRSTSEQSISGITCQKCAIFITFSRVCVCVCAVLFLQSFCNSCAIFK